MKADNSYNFREVAENLFDAVFAFNKENEIVFVNKALLKFLQYSGEKIEGKPSTELVPEKEKEKIEGVLRRIVSGKQIKDFSTITLTKNGNEIPVDFSGFPLHDEKENIVGGVAILVDVRQVRGLLDALSRSKRELENRVQERTSELEEKTQELREKVEELEKMNKFMVGRENKMIRLKEENKKLKKKLKEFEEDVEVD